MEKQIQNSFIKQINNVLMKYNKARSRIRNQDPTECQKIITLSRAVIERTTGTSSPYYKQTKEILNTSSTDWEKTLQLVGVLESLKIDLEANYLQTYEELIHGEIFSDFMEMASYLLEKKYKDAAAVIASSSLEAHLRQLCKKHGIDVTYVNKKGDRAPKKASHMNDELAKFYGKTEQKGVTFWLDIRNNAAHGKYDEYTEEQVQNMHIGILEFMIRHPA